MRFRYSGIALASLLLSLPVPLHAQTNVTVEVKEVIDNRLSTGVMSSSLEVYATLDGKNLEKATAARVVLDEATDDRGNNLLGKGDAPDFTSRDSNSGTLNISIASPPREATSVRLRGKVELFVPSRDPNAVFRVDNALAQLDKPMASKKLRDAKLTITPLSVEGYARARESRKITEADLVTIREQAKAEGATDQELELAIGFAKAMEEAGNEPLPEGTLIFSGKKSEFERVYAWKLLSPAGEEIPINGRQSSSRGDDIIMILSPSAAVPPKAALEVTMLTAKSRVTVPFHLKNVRLP